VKKPSIAVLACLALASCAESTPPKPPPLPSTNAATAPAPEAKKEDPSQPVVVLVDAGAEPRRALRYAFAKHDETMQLDTKVGQSSSMGPQQKRAVTFPTVRVLVVLKPQSIDGDGSLTQKFEITHAEVLHDEPSVPKEMYDALTKDMPEFVGLGGTTVFTARGIPTSFKPSGSPKSAAVQQLVETTNEALREMAAPLPEEPVGVGAKWELRLKDEGVQTMTYTLKELAPNRATVTVDGHATEPPRTLPAPQGAPPDLRVQVDKHESKGGGSMTFPLDRMAPTISLEFSTNIQGTIHRGDQKQPMDTMQTIKVAMKPLTK